MNWMTSRSGLNCSRAFQVKKLLTHAFSTIGITKNTPRPIHNTIGICARTATTSESIEPPNIKGHKKRLYLGPSIITVSNSLVSSISHYLSTNIPNSVSNSDYYPDHSAGSDTKAYAHRPGTPDSPHSHPAHYSSHRWYTAPQTSKDHTTAPPQTRAPTAAHSK